MIGSVERQVNLCWEDGFRMVSYADCYAEATMVRSIGFCVVVVRRMIGVAQSLVSTR